MRSQIIELRYQPINKHLFLFGKLQQMDIESIGKGRQSKHSQSSGRQSYLSLEALTEPRLSIRQKTSLIEIMDLQVSRNSYRKSGNMMIEQNDGNFGIRLSEKSGQNYSFKLNMEEKDLNRKSNFKTNHECSCQDYENHCNGVHCICFLTPRQICVIGQCCPKCVESKNDFLRETRGWHLQGQKKQKQTQSEENLAIIAKQKKSKNMHYLKQIYSKDPCMQNITFCTCKKSHCQKNYCLCYEKGVKCSQFCSCIECLNVDKCEYEQGLAQQQKRWQRYATYTKQQQMPAEKVEDDIDYFLHQQLQSGTQLNQTMQFQPVNFQNVLSNNYQ